jgi:hypothetical protein
MPIPGIRMPQDWSPLWTSAMPMSSIEGITTTSNVLAAWSIQSGWQDAGGVMKLWEDGSGLSFPITSASASSPSTDPSQRDIVHLGVEPHWVSTLLKGCDAL